MPKGIYRRTKVHSLHIGESLKEYAKNNPEKSHERAIRAGKIGGPAAQKKLKRENKSFYNSEVQVVLSKRAIKMQRENKLGFFDSKLQSRLGKIGGKKSAEINRRNKTGFYFDKRLQSKGGLASVKSQRENYPYYFMDVPFHSEGERQLSIWQLLNWGILPEEGVNYHVKVGSHEFDSRPFSWLFAEYHPWDIGGLLNEKYYASRRKILDDNGFQACELAIIKSVKALAEVLKLIEGEKELCLYGRS